MSENKLIRNSTAEFLIFTAQDGKNSIEARYENETIWLTQKLMGELFEVGTNTVNYHFKELFKSGEIEENSVIRKFRITANDGKSLKTDVTIAKNYLTKDELESLGRIVNAYLDLAEDWAKRLDLFLEYDDREVLKQAELIANEITNE